MVMVEGKALQEGRKKGTAVSKQTSGVDTLN